MVAGGAGKWDADCAAGVIAEKRVGGKGQVSAGLDEGAPGDWQVDLHFCAEERGVFDTDIPERKPV